MLGVRSPAKCSLRRIPVTERNYVIFASYGNDSIALIQWMHEQGHDDAFVVYSDTGWAAPWWAERVEKAEGIVYSYGMEPVRIESMGFVPLVKLRKGFPRNGMQFCTTELKIKPALAWLDRVDPDKDLTCCVGVRRSESRSRSSWPEWTPESPNHGGRELWAPLVRVWDAKRDALVRRSGFDVLPHRSMECYPCVNANRADLRMVDEERIAYIEQVEAEMGYTSKGKPRTMFRPKSKMGAVGIREVKRWAETERGGYEPPSGGCDGGMCGL